MSSPQHLDFFQFVTWIFFPDLCYKSSFFLGEDQEENSGLQDLKIL